MTAMSDAWPPLALSLVASVALVCGAALPALRTRLFEHRLTLLIGFSAGIMLATALHELIPESIQKSGEAATWGAAAGFLLLYAAERFTHFHACRHRQCELDEDIGEHPELRNVIPLVAAECAHDHDHDNDHEHHDHIHHAHPHGHIDLTAMVGMSIHNFADGLTTAAAFQLSRTVGLVVVLAIVLHQMAAGLSLGAIMVRLGRPRRRVLVSTTIVASFIFWGAVFYRAVVPVSVAAQGVVLGIAAGSFLYVAACDLLPEAHLDDEGWSVTVMTLLGYGAAAAINLLHV